jgi:SAM-dependent methyltransferase
MYDQFSLDYDRFVNWNNRLSYELPFLERVLAGRPRVLDAACGTGMHAIELARLGYAAAGADISTGMIEHARQNAQQAGFSIRFEPVGFGGLTPVFGAASQDAVLCLGNSLPHALERQDQAAALADFAACLRPGGRLILQNRNFDKVLLSKERWMEPQAYRQGEDEEVFLRFYDYRSDGLIDFNILTLRRTTSGWEQSIAATRLYPLTSRELLLSLPAAGFGLIQTFGSMDGSGYASTVSENLILCAEKL